MNNQYDEIKKLLDASRKMMNKEDLKEQRETLIDKGLLKEEDLDSEDVGYETADIDNDEVLRKEKKKSYRISGGLMTLHGKNKKDLTLSSEEKVSFQETMDEFVNEVSDLSDFGTLNLYKHNVDWSGKVIDFDLEFYFTIGEKSGVYINGDMLKLNDELIEMINKLTSFYEKFKSKWAKVLSQRKKTQSMED